MEESRQEQDGGYKTAKWESCILNCTFVSVRKKKKKRIFCSVKSGRSVGQKERFGRGRNEDKACK